MREYFNEPLKTNVVICLKVYVQTVDFNFDRP
jgi:hypothetical protein